MDDIRTESDQSGEIIRIVVVMLTMNQREKTLSCLESLFANGDPWVKVVLWDNGSRDGTLESVNTVYPQVFTIYSPTNLGVASGRNAAATAAIRQLGATHLLFLDNDIQVETGFVQALFLPFTENSLVGQTQAKLRFMHDRSRINDGGGAQIDFVFWRTRPVGYGEVDRGQHNVSRECVSCGGAMMVRADLFQQLEGFDPIFGPFGPEDLDFSLRLKKSGYLALYVSEAVGYHQVSHTFGGGYSEEYAQHKARHWQVFMRRHAPLWQKIAFYLIGAPYLVVRVTLREGRKGNWKAVRGLLRGVLAR